MRPGGRPLPTSDTETTRRADGAAAGRDRAKGGSEAMGRACLKRTLAANRDIARQPRPNLLSLEILWASG